MQSHSKETGKDVMIYNDITWAWDWTQVCYIYRRHEWSIGQAVSEIFSFVFFFFWLGGWSVEGSVGVVGVLVCSPWTQSVVGACGPGAKVFGLPKNLDPANSN